MMSFSVRKGGKRAAALLLSLLLTASVCPLAAYAEETSAKTTEYVNLRSGPGTNYDSKGVLAEGTSITVTDTSNSEWYAVKTAAGTGYIFSRYIALGGSGSSAKTTEYVNLRSGPGTSYSSKGVIASGTAITVTDTSNSEWYAVQLSNGTTGYMFSEYIKMSGSSSSSSESESAPSTESTAAKTTEYVNVRSGPGTNYSSKGVIASGTSLTVTDRSNSEWYAVKLSNGTTGYIYSIYLKITSEGGSSEKPADGSVQAKTTADVNLRRGAGTSFGVITVLDTGITVTVTEATNAQWYKVKLSNGTEGYLFTEYLKITSGDINSVKPESNPTPAPGDGTVTAKTTTDINLRKGPGTSYGVIDVIDEGVSVTVTEATNSEWYKVKLSDGREGYFSAQYLKITSGDISSVKPASKIQNFFVSPTFTYSTLEISEPHCATMERPGSK